jgi:hypothetical protein
MFDSRNASIDCKMDNIVVYGENRHKVFDYCQRKVKKEEGKRKVFMGVRHFSKELTVQFTYGNSNPNPFSVSFEWIIFEILDLNATASDSLNSITFDNSVYSTSTSFSTSSITPLIEVDATTAPLTTTLSPTSR